MNTQLADISPRPKRCPAPDGAEVWSADEIPFDVALEVVNSADINSRLAAARTLFGSLFRDLKQLNPIATDSGKYLNLEISAHGYDSDHPDQSTRVYFGSELHLMNVVTFEEIADALNTFDPEQRKAKLISKLRAELAELEKD